MTVASHITIWLFHSLHLCSGVYVGQTIKWTPLLLNLNIIWPISYMVHANLMLFATPRGVDAAAAVLSLHIWGRGKSSVAVDVKGKIKGRLVSQRTYQDGGDDEGSVSQRIGDVYPFPLWHFGDVKTSRCTPFPHLRKIKPKCSHVCQEVLPYLWWGS